MNAVFRQEVSDPLDEIGDLLHAVLEHARDEQETTPSDNLNRVARPSGLRTSMWVLPSQSSKTLRSEFRLVGRFVTLLVFCQGGCGSIQR
jgi:hypothetical protein